MLVVFLSLILAFVISFLVTMDASSANLYFGATTLLGIPMFFVVFISIVVGMLLASMATIKNIIESKLTIFGQKRDLKKSFKTADELESKVNKLEEENLVLKEKIKEQAHPQ